MRSTIDQRGFTLLEMLVASSILALAIAVAMPLMLTAQRDRKALQTATDRIQSLRLVTSLATQDARFATACGMSQRPIQDSSGGFVLASYVRLTTRTDAEGWHVIDYIFADQTNRADPSNLHRLQGTVLPGQTEAIWERDDIAGRDLVWTEEPGANGSSLECEGAKKLSLVLVTVVDAKTARRASLKVSAYLRPFP